MSVAQLHLIHRLEPLDTGTLRALINHLMMPGCLIDLYSPQRAYDIARWIYRERRVDEATRYLDQVSGSTDPHHQGRFRLVCAECNDERLPGGDWGRRAENLPADRISHGLCPACARRWSKRLVDREAS